MTKPRRPKGDGGIARYRRDGRLIGWRVWVDAGENMAGKRIRRSVVVRGTEDDARKRLRSLLEEIDQGSYDPSDNVTVAQFFRRWWPGKAGSLSPTSALGVRRVLEKYALPRIGKRPVDRVKATDLSPLIGALVEQGKLGQADHLYRNLRLLFNAAVRQRVIPRTPMEGVERPAQTHREMVTLSPAEWRRIYDHLSARESWAVLPFSILLTCGLRRSELCGLRWADIDFDCRLMLVQRSYHVLSGGKRLVRAPKTKRGRRAIALDPWTAQGLTEHRAEALRAADMLKRPFSQTDYVFARLDGSPWPPDTYSQLWRRTMAQLGLNCRLHDLRHSSASLLLASGADIRLISARLGHSTPAFTLSQYVHLLPDAQAEAADRLAAFLQNGHRPALPATAKIGT